MSTRNSAALIWIAENRGIDVSNMSPRSLLSEFDTALYAAGFGTVDIQRWVGWKSSIYTRCVRRGDFRMRHLSAASTAPTRLADHLDVDLEVAKKVKFDERFRNGWRTTASLINRRIQFLNLIPHGPVWAVP